MAPATGLFRAIDWAFDQTGDLTWGDLRILVTDPALITRLSLLQRLKSRRVRIGTAEQAVRARSFHGIMIAYCPDARRCRSPTRGPGGGGGIGQRDQLAEWVAAYAPQHLGGEIVPADPQATAPASSGSGHTLQPSG